MISKIREDLMKYPDELARCERQIPHLHAMAPTAETLDQCTELTRLLQRRATGYGGDMHPDALCARIAELDATACDGHGVSPLNSALLHGQPMQVLEALVTAGADVNAADDNGVFPLEIAMVRFDAKVVDFLRKAKVDGTRRFDHNRTYAHLAVRRAVSLAGLKKTKADINAPDDYGWRPVHYAALGVGPTMQEVVRNRAELDTPTPQGDTALALAAKNTLSKRVEHWASEGMIGGAEASYTIEDGVMTFRMKGKPRKIAPKDERILARRLGNRDHGHYLNALDVVLSLAKKATLALNSADGTPIVQLLADLQRPEVEKIIGKRGVSLPAPRKVRKVKRPDSP